MTTLITTPIFYVNAQPHLGHAFSMLIADAHARWRRKLNHQPIKFTTGTDEHGQKIWLAARNNNQKVEDWCDEISGKFKSFANKLNISNTDFIRTSEPRHHKIVQELWKKLVKKGDIYKGSHEGWYSISDESFYTADETKILSCGKRVALESGNDVDWVSEINYKFKLAKYIPRVKEWLSTADPILPSSRANDLKSFIDIIERDQQDLSISRRRSIVKWGISVPGTDKDEDDQIIYVWLDALSNYLTALSESKTPEQDEMIHIVGKDILKFHAIYWPAILCALGDDYKLPKKIIAHGHWTINNFKMSKSLGNVVDPIELIDSHFSGQPDPLRYFLLRTGKLNSDSPFNLENFFAVYNNELVGNLGNLISRIFKKYSANEMDEMYKIDNIDLDLDLKSKIKILNERSAEFYDQFQYGQVADLSMDVLNAANRFVSRVEPWKFTDPRDHLHVASQISNILFQVSSNLSPIIPDSSDRINSILNGSLKLPERGGLFPRINW